MNKNFWKNKRVIITGNSGFIGSWLTICLNGMGAKVFGYSKGPNTIPSLYVLGTLKFVTFNPYYQDTWDITNKETIKACFDVAKPDIIIHLAHQSIIDQFCEDILPLQKENALGMTTLLDVCKEYPSIKIILNSVPDNNYIFDNYNSNDPEIISDLYYQNTFKEQNKGLAVARIANIIGGGNYTNDILSYCIKSFIENKIAELNYNQNDIYNHLHVLDLVNGYINLCEKLWENPEQNSHSWVFSNDNENYITIQDAANIICNVLGNGATVNWKPNIVQDDFILTDNTQTKQELNWSIKLNSHLAIEKTIQWHKDLLAGHSTLDLCQKQIETYIG